MECWNFRFNLRDLPIMQFKTTNVCCNNYDDSSIQNLVLSPHIFDWFPQFAHVALSLILKQISTIYFSSQRRTHNILHNVEPTDVIIYLGYKEIYLIGLRAFQWIGNSVSRGNGQVSIILWIITGFCVGTSFIPPKY